MSSEEIRIYSSFGKELAPQQMTEGSVGVDVRAPRDIHLPYGCRTKVNTGLVVDVSDFIEKDRPIFTMAVPRSSAGIDKGVEFLNTVGVIDPDYSGYNPETGEADEIYIFLRRRLRSLEVLKTTHFHIPTKDYVQNGDPIVLDMLDNRFPDIDFERYKHEVVEYSDGGGVIVAAYLLGGNPETNSLIYEDGERFCQLLFLPYQASTLKLIKKHQLKDNTRGGLGSTGDS